MSAKHKSNRARLAIVMDEVAAILADVKETNSMMDAGRIGGRYDDLGKCQLILENINTELDQIDILL